MFLRLLATITLFILLYNSQQLLTATRYISFSCSSFSFAFFSSTQSRLFAPDKYDITN